MRNKLIQKIVSSSAMLGCLPELPNFNGSILQIDDEERDRICKDLDEASTGLTTIVDQHAAMRNLIELMFSSTLPYNNGECTFNDDVAKKWAEIQKGFTP